MKTVPSTIREHLFELRDSLKPHRCVLVLWDDPHNKKFEVPSDRFYVVTQGMCILVAWQEDGHYCCYDNETVRQCIPYALISTFTRIELTHEEEPTQPLQDEFVLEPT